MHKTPYYKFHSIYIETPKQAIKFLTKGLRRVIDNQFGLRYN